MKTQTILIFCCQLAAALALGSFGAADLFSFFTINVDENDIAANDTSSDDVDVTETTPLPLHDRGPPPHEEAARMARYIMHNSGEKHSGDFDIV